MRLGNLTNRSAGRARRARERRLSHRDTEGRLQAGWGLAPHRDLCTTWRGCSERLKFEVHTRDYLWRGKPDRRTAPPRGRPDAPGALEALGAVCQRPRWARSARTTAPTAPPGSTSARPRAVAGVSLERDGLAGISDRHQEVCLALRCGTARPNPEGTVLRSHRQRRQPREDVKEYYFYLDSTPTHSYMRML